MCLCVCGGGRGAGGGGGGTHVYSIPLGHLQDGIDGVDVSQSTVLYINNKVELTYINLISACSGGETPGNACILE